MAFVYHYHATKQVSPGNVVNIDGLLLMNSGAIVNMALYHEAKDMIVEDQGLGSSMGLVIKSLSMLHEVIEKPDGWEGIP